MNNHIVKIYSDAFFEISLKYDLLEVHKNELNEIGTLFKQNQKLYDLMQSPDIVKSEKKKMIEDVFVGYDKNIINLLKVLIDKSRFEILNDFVVDFNEKYNIKNNISQGNVYSAKPLNKEELSGLENVLSKKMNKNIKLINTIDETLISGISVVVDGKRIDNNIKNRLENLRSLMKERGRN